MSDQTGKFSAVLDPAGNAQHDSPFSIQWHPAEDSQVEIRSDSLSIQRGHGARMVAYFRLDPRFASLPSSHYTVDLEYVDTGRGSWFLEHVALEADSQGRYPWRQSQKVSLQNDGRIKQSKLVFDGARMTGHANGADFRIVVVDPEVDAFELVSLVITTHSVAEALSKNNILPSQHYPIKLPVIDDPEVSVIIPVFNQLEYTLACLRAVSEFTHADFELVVVNDGSTDDTASRLSEIEGLRLINHPSNQGFAKACNTGARHARGTCLVFLNNDTAPQPGWLGALLACRKRNHKAGVIGSRLIFPQTNEIQSAGVEFGQYRLPVDQYQYYSPSDPCVSVDREVDAVCGASMLVDKSLFESIGGFDESYLNGLEDVDLCLQLQRLGYGNFLCASSDVLHYKSASEGRFGVEKDRANTTLFHAKWNDYLTRRESDDSQALISSTDLPMAINSMHPNLESQTGEQRAGSVVCQRGVHSSGHCVYGPYLQIGEAFAAQVMFHIKLSNLQAECVDLVSIDVYDSVGDQVLAERVVRQDELVDCNDDYTLYFSAQQGQILEFRVFWHGTCDAEFIKLVFNVCD